MSVEAKVGRQLIKVNQNKSNDRGIDDRTEVYQSICPWWKGPVFRERV